MADKIPATLGTLKDLAERSPMAGAAIVVFVLGVLGSYVFRSKRLNFPIQVVGDSSLKKALIEGTLKYPETPFILPGSWPLLILPMSTFEEVRALPENQVSFYKHVNSLFFYEQTGVGAAEPEYIRTVRVDLTRNIASAIDGLQNEIRYALDKELGRCEDWAPHKAYPLLTRIIALLSGRVFVGRPLSREEEWISSTINYTRDLSNARKALLKYPKFLLSLIAPFVPEIKSLMQHEVRGGELLEPIVKECLEKEGKEKISVDESQDQQGTFCSWLLKQFGKRRASLTPEKMAHYQMELSFAAIHTTTSAICQILYDLAARPEYLQPLRDEIDQVIQEDGYDKDGEGFLKLKKVSLTKLRKMDSFMKESQRLAPMGIVSNLRITAAPVNLSTGHIIPKNTYIAYPSYAVHMSPSTTTFSPAYNPADNLPPDQFDGFRFARLRAMEGKENRHQFVTTSVDSLVFGHGAHACPGRFFASNEIKVILIELLRNWEFRLKGGAAGEEARPKNYESDVSLIPNPFAEVEFKRMAV